MAEPGRTSTECLLNACFSFFLCALPALGSGDSASAVVVLGLEPRLWESPEFWEGHPHSTVSPTFRSSP